MKHGGSPLARTETVLAMDGDEASEEEESSKPCANVASIDSENRLAVSAPQTRVSTSTTGATETEEAAAGSLPRHAQHESRVMGLAAVPSGRDWPTVRSAQA